MKSACLFACVDQFVGEDGETILKRLFVIKLNTVQPLLFFKRQSHDLCLTLKLTLIMYVWFGD